MSNGQHQYCFHLRYPLIVAASFTIQQSKTILSDGVRADRTAAHRKLDQRRVYLCADGLRKHAQRLAAAMVSRDVVIALICPPPVLAAFFLAISALSFNARL